MEDKKPFKTADMGMATYFCVKGRTVLGCVPTDRPGQMDFVFEDFPERDKLVEDWLTGHGEARTLKHFYNMERICKKLVKDPIR